MLDADAIRYLVSSIVCIAWIGLILWLKEKCDE